MKDGATLDIVLFCLLVVVHLLASEDKSAMKASPHTKALEKKCLARCSKSEELFRRTTLIVGRVLEWYQ